MTCQLSDGQLTAPVPDVNFVVCQEKHTSSAANTFWVGFYYFDFSMFFVFRFFFFLTSLHASAQMFIYVLQSETNQRNNPDDIIIVV